MIICGCAIEAQYVRQQINEKKTKDFILAGKSLSKGR